MGYKIRLEATHPPTHPAPGFFFTSDQKTSFTKCFSFVSRGSKLIFKTGNGIVQTGNGIMRTGNEIVSPTSGPLIKKISFQSFFYMFQRIQNRFLKKEMELSKQEMELFLPLPGLQSKNFFL